MTDANSIKHLSVVMTTQTADDVTQTTASNVVVLSSSSSGIELYFQCAVVVIGVVGTAANVLILYGLVASKQHKKNVLIFNQNVLDFSSSLLLVITYSVKLGNLYLTGLSGSLICALILSENVLWSLILASKVNLTIVTVERYLKVVHSVWSKKKLRDWMIYSGMALSWIIGFVQNFPTTVVTSDVIGGACWGMAIWENSLTQLAYGIWTFVGFYALIILIIVLCYWRILVVIRRQAHVMAGHGSSTAQTQSRKIQNNVIKTMITVRQINISQGSVATND